MHTLSVVQARVRVICVILTERKEKKTRVHAVAIKVTRLNANATSTRKTHLTCLRFVL